MKIVLRLVVGLFKLSFLAVVFMWAMIMNFIGIMVCAISSQG